MTKKDAFVSASECEDLVKTFLNENASDILAHVDGAIAKFTGTTARGPITASTLRARILAELGFVVRHHN